MPERKSKATVLRLLEPCFGHQKAELLIDVTAHELELSDLDTYSIDEVDAILTHLGKAPGLIGISARFAQSRLQRFWDSSV